MKTTHNNVKTNNTKGVSTMTIQEYAQTIAQSITGATVNEVEKANGVILTAVTFPTDKENIKGNFYVDDFYKDGEDIEDVIERIRALQRKQTPDFDIEFIYKWESVRPHLRARLYNVATSADVKKSASEYGFNDLIIVPYIEDVCKDGAVKVTSELVKMWKVTPDEVLQIAEENSKERARLESMTDVLRAMGMDIPPMFEDPMIIATNEHKTFGAYAVIAKLDELMKRFKNGFTVLPSSVHEVIIVDRRDEREMSAMVSEVNDTTVEPDIQLSNHAYTFVA